MKRSTEHSTLFANQRGSIAPALMLAMFALVGGAFFFLRQAQAASMAADADTAADAAALAGADAVRETSVIPIAMMMATGRIPPGLEGQARARAADYANRNGATLQQSRLWKVPDRNAIHFEATVRDDETVDGGRATRTSSAEITWEIAIQPGNCMSQSAVDALIIQARLGGRHNGASGLVACRGRDTVNLDPEFKLGFLEAEAVMKERGGEDTIILLWSAYRSVVEQARLYAAYQAGTGGIAAPPGQSYHNYGRAVDVENYNVLRAALADSRYGGVMYWPDIPNDAGHFQDERGRGNLSQGLGNAYGLLEFDDTRLVATP